MTLAVSSEFNSKISKLSIAIFKTTPPTPSSETKRLLPFPVMNKGMLFCFENSKTFSTSFIVFATTKKSAGPPILNDVCFDIGSSILTLSSEIIFLKP